MEQTLETARDSVLFASVSSLTVHPIAKTLPGLPPDEWTAFVESVRESGVQEPLAIVRGDVVIDGRLRLEAAKECGITDVPVRYVELDEQEQEQFIYRSLLHRRHLTDDQRAILAARWKVVRMASVKKNVGASESRYEPIPGLEHIRASPGKRRSDVEGSILFNVPVWTIRNAAELVNNHPDAAAAVLAGQQTLGQARRELIAKGELHERPSKEAAKERYRLGSAMSKGQIDGNNVVLPLSAGPRLIAITIREHYGVNAAIAVAKALQEVVQGE